MVLWAPSVLISRSSLVRGASVKACVSGVLTVSGTLDARCVLFFVRPLGVV